MTYYINKEEAIFALESASLINQKKVSYGIDHAIEILKNLDSYTPNEIANMHGVE